MKKRILALMMACLLLAGCGPVRTDPADAQIWDTNPEFEVTVAYVPLDDRPDNEERVIYLAESLGYTLLMPERDLYHTVLDGQPTNSNGTQSGDRAALYEWVLAQEAAGCDRYVLFMDQLLSGGLVNSRHMTDWEDIILSDGTVLTELEAMETLLQTLAADEANQVWLLDSVMRLAPTVGYAGFGIDEYNALRAYGMEPRPELQGGAAEIGQVVRKYGYAADGTPLLAETFGLTGGQVADYLYARCRKLELTAAMQKLVAGEGYEQFRVLIGIDDSSAENSIQKNEIAFFRARLREKDALLSGVDDLAFKAMARLYQEDLGAELAVPRTFVSYYGGTEDRPACAYDYQPLNTIVEEHIDFFGLERAASVADAQMHILVLTQPLDAAKKAEYYDALIRQLNENEKNQLPTVLIDAGNGTYGTAFHEALTEKCNLGWLISYAGFLDMAIVTGTAMSHGVARYAALHDSRGRSQQAERAFIRTVTDSILKDFCYKHIVRPDILNYVRGELGGSADNYYQPPVSLELLQARLESGMKTATAPVIRNLERSNFISALEPYGVRGWGGIGLDNYRYPWDRAFEIGMDIHLGEFTEPHESILGLYYK